jgi:hypothetical protein
MSGPPAVGPLNRLEADRPCHMEAIEKSAAEIVAVPRQGIVFVVRLQ